MASDERPHGFWSSISGILTALAAVITAIAGLVVALKPSPQPQLTGGPVESRTVTVPNTPQRDTKPPDPLASPTPSPLIAADWHREVQARQNNGDSVRLISISPPPGTSLIAGRETPLTFRIGYTLKSSKSATLYVQIAQFDRDPSSGCEGSGHIPDAAGTKITAGSGEVVVEVIWRGGVSKDLAPSAGHIAPTFSFWSSKRELISNFPTISEACYRFSS